MTARKLDQVNWGIIGVGDVCEVKSAPAMQLVPGSRLVAVMRRTARLAEDYANRHHVPRWYDDADNLIQDPDINAIYIATPPDGHLPYTLKAAAAGKAVYVEKPMARNYTECQQMIKACEQAGVPLFVAYYRRCLPHFVKVKQWLEQGKIGEVRHVNVQLNQAVRPQLLSRMNNEWRIDPEIAGGGYFYDLGSHQLDLLDYLLGPIQQAHGIATNQAGYYSADDMVCASFMFESGATGTGNWCFNSSQSATRDITEIIGSQGIIRYATFSGGDVTLLVDGKKTQQFSCQLPKHIQQPLIQTVVVALTENSHCPSTGASAARTNWVMEQICQ
ncbi:Gfo/Idh/MocA family protein [Neptunicella sp. SCSIO 80796]|uniref:Gfo/Idh/MocA family protein n=1 Tax=Neptunicella plasticusilytica TaxID=3117012 RepID=UPI003A4E12D2